MITLHDHGGDTGLTLCLLSDTHGHLDPRIAAVAAACDGVVHAGDVGAAAVLAALKPRAGVVVAVRGNNDVPHKWPAGDLRWLAALPEQATIALPGGVLAIEHGHRLRSARAAHHLLRARHAGARAVVVGHTHRWVADIDAAPWVLNPGAAGRVRTYGGPSCLVLHASRASWWIALHRFTQQEPLRRRGVARR